MANTYAWTINKLDVRPTQDELSNVVYNIHWTYTATSDQLDSEGNPYTTNFIGTSLIGEPDPSDFIDFDNLTQEQVEGWLAYDINIANIQENADKALNDLINPTSVTKDVPW